jgi:hypothetical protein
MSTLVVKGVRVATAWPDRVCPIDIIHWNINESVFELCPNTLRVSG